MVAYYAVFVGYIAVFERSHGGPETSEQGTDASDDDGGASHPLLLGPTRSTELSSHGASGVPPAGGAPGNGHDIDSSWFSRLQSPLHWIARLTMPEVATQGTSFYPRACAVLLPITAPLFVVLVKRLALGEAPFLNEDALLYGAVCSGFASVTTAALYPPDGRHRGLLTGFFTAMAFGMSVLWMNILSAEMVRAWKVRRPGRLEPDHIATMP